MGAGGRRGRFSDINVTPLVDVMLVLLVIFMITAPMMFNGISLTLPKTTKVNQIKLSHDRVILSISPTGEFYLGKDKILMEELGGILRERLAQTKNKVLYIRAHYQLKYGRVARMMSYLKAEGFQQLALVTETKR